MSIVFIHFILKAKAKILLYREGGVGPSSLLPGTAESISLGFRKPDCEIRRIEAMGCAGSHRSG
jgi:hypothetical protein